MGAKDSTQEKVNEGMSFLSWLQLLFIGLKLTGYLDHWSWWWVWSPTLGALGVVVLLLIVIGLLYGFT